MTKGKFKPKFKHGQKVKVVKYMEDEKDMEWQTGCKPPPLRTIMTVLFSENHLLEHGYREWPHGFFYELDDGHRNEFGERDKEYPMMHEDELEAVE